MKGGNNGYSIPLRPPKDLAQWPADRQAEEMNDIRVVLPEPAAKTLEIRQFIHVGIADPHLPGRSNRVDGAFVELGGTLEAEALNSVIARTASSVIRCDVGVLSLVESVDGTARIAAAAGADSVVGMRIGPGEGAAGRAIATRTAVLDDRLDHARFPRAAQALTAEQAVSILALGRFQPAPVRAFVDFLLDRRDELQRLAER